MKMFTVLFKTNALNLFRQNNLNLKCEIYIFISKIHSYIITKTKLNQTQTYHYNLLHGYSFPYCNYILTDIEIQTMEIDTVKCNYFQRILQSKLQMYFSIYLAK